MSRIVATTHDILERVLKMARLVPNVERHLLNDQADAIVKASGHASGTRSGGHSDPTPGLVAALAPYSAQERELHAAIGAVDKALSEAEKTCLRLLSGKPAKDEGPRCPGWNHELRSRFGGCGKVLETWTDSRGMQHNRSELLCSSCRRAAERDARMSHAAYDD